VGGAGNIDVDGTEGPTIKRYLKAEAPSADSSGGGDCKEIGRKKRVKTGLSAAKPGKPICSEKGL